MVEDKKNAVSEAKSTESYSAFYVRACIMGALMGGFSLPFEHPWDRVKTQSQAYPTLQPRKIATEIYRQFGIKGFYSGGIPNTFRAVIKQAYRIPLQHRIGHFYEEKINSFSQQQRYLPSKEVFTGLFIACLETYIVTPLEKLKVEIMTNPNKNKKLSDVLYHSDHKLSSRELIQKLYTGSNVVLNKQIASWISFLWAETFFKNQAQHYFQQKNLSFTQLIAVSMLVNVANTIVNMPFDAVKTRVQKKVNPDPVPKGLLGVPKKIVSIAKTEGLRVLYRGSLLRLGQCMVQSTLTVQVKDRLEKQYKSMTMR